MSDFWEKIGADTDNDGLIDVNLPAMGANPERKDIFVEIDCMVGFCPSQEALDMVVAAFWFSPNANNPDGSEGIVLHIDNGPNSPMIFTVDETTQQVITIESWDSLSNRTPLPHYKYLASYQVGFGFDWTAFDEIKQSNFERTGVFHYSIFADRIFTLSALFDCEYSGLARSAGPNENNGGAGSDFLIALGGWSDKGCSVVQDNLNGTPFRQAWTFMHELGHNLGLRHGGGDNTNFKPNYLSIMNYLFKNGIYTSSVSRVLNYSETNLDLLYENQLNESIGLGPDELVPDNYRIHYKCPNSSQNDPLAILTDLDSSIDWNCQNGGNETNIEADINQDYNISGAEEPLKSHQDWGVNMIFDGGGAIGDFGPGWIHPLETSINEPPYSEYEQFNIQYDFSLIGSGFYRVIPGQNLNLVITVVNVGSEEDSYIIEYSNTDFLDISELPNNLSLLSGESASFSVLIFIPDNFQEEVEEIIKIQVNSENSEVYDIETIVLEYRLDNLYLPIVTK